MTRRKQQPSPPRACLVAALTPEVAATLREQLKRYIDLEAKSARAAEARSRLEPGSSRARVTTANARWARAAESRDLAQQAAERTILSLVKVL